MSILNNLIKNWQWGGQPQVGPSPTLTGLGTIQKILLGEGVRGFLIFADEILVYPSEDWQNLGAPPPSED